MSEPILKVAVEGSDLEYIERVRTEIQSLLSDDVKLINSDVLGQNEVVDAYVRVVECADPDTAESPDDHFIAAHEESEEPSILIETQDESEFEDELEALIEQLELMLEESD